MTRSPVTNESKLWKNLRKKLDIGYTVFIQKNNTTLNWAKCATTDRAHNAFCPLTQARLANCPFDWPITQSNNKHDAHTVLLLIGQCTPLNLVNKLILALTTKLRKFPNSTHHILNHRQRASISHAHIETVIHAMNINRFEKLMLD